MANWIKVRHELVRSPKLWHMARVMKSANKHTALGVAVAWLVWLDEQTQDGNTGMSKSEVDDLLGAKGAADALVYIGWAGVSEDGTVVALDFDKHNGESAKSRADTAQRVAKSKKKRKSNAVCDTLVTENCYQDGGTPLPNALPRIRIRDNKEAQMEDDSVSARAGFDGEGFSAWVGALAMAHPALSRCRVLPPDVVAAAREAFFRLPDAAAEAELVSAYMADRMQEDRWRKAFYRPDRGSLYFESLERVLDNARRWAREAGWKPRAVKKADDSPALPQQQEVMATPQQQEEFLRGLREDAQMGGGGSSR